MPKAMLLRTPLRAILLSYPVLETTATTLRRRYYHNQLWLRDYTLVHSETDI